MLSQAEENYLKTLFHLTNESSDKTEVGTNELASALNVKPATANDMLKKLKEKKFVSYERYGKISLTPLGEENAIIVVRKHRLWETFLYEKLDFSWDEVHEVAEQLEHIHSQKLIEKLDEFLDFPEVDPHGDAIPNAKGKLKIRVRNTLSQVEEGAICKVVSVNDNGASFLQYVNKLGLELNSTIKVISRQDFDGTMEIELNNKKINVSQKMADNIFVI